MASHIDLRTFAEDGPFSEAEVDQNWTDIEQTVNDLVDESTPPASNEQIWQGAEQKAVTPEVMFTSSAPVTLTDAATISIDFNAGLNFSITLGGNRSLSNPANQKAGQSGIIIIKQDGSGGRTLSFDTDYRFVGGIPNFSTSANAIDIVAYFVESAGTVLCTFAGGE